MNGLSFPCQMMRLFGVAERRSIAVVVPGVYVHRAAHCTGVSRAFARRTTRARKPRDADMTLYTTRRRSGATDSRRSRTSAPESLLLLGGGWWHERICRTRRLRDNGGGGAFDKKSSRRDAIRRQPVPQTHPFRLRHSSAAPSDSVTLPPPLPTTPLSLSMRAGGGVPSRSPLDRTRCCDRRMGSSAIGGAVSSDITSAALSFHNTTARAANHRRLLPSSSSRMSSPRTKTKNGPTALYCETAHHVTHPLSHGARQWGGVGSQSFFPLGGGRGTDRQTTTHTVRFGGFARAQACARALAGGREVARARWHGVTMTLARRVPWRGSRCRTRGGSS